jgi:uncharacterized protein YciI
MATFVMTCIDHPNSLERRMGVREAHLAYVRDNIAMVKLAGPLLDEAGNMAGSLFIIEADSAPEVTAFNAADPYTLAGVFESVDIRAIRITVGAIAESR